MKMFRPFYSHILWVATSCSFALLIKHFLLRSIWKNVDQLLGSLRLEILRDLCAFLIPSRQVHTSERALNNLLKQFAWFLLVLNACILDGTFWSSIIHLHPVRIVLIRLNPVCNHVDDNVAIRILGHFDVRLSTSERCRIIGRHLTNFGEELYSSILSHFSVLECEAEDLQKYLSCLLLDHAIIIFQAIPQ